FRREAHAISLSTAGLVVGLYALSPAALLGAVLAGAAAAELVVRRQDGAKLVSTLAERAITTSIAIAVFHAVLALGRPFGPAGWLAALLATVAASLAGALLGRIGIAIGRGATSFEKLVVSVGISLVAAIAIANVALIAIELVRVDRATILLL